MKGWLWTLLVCCLFSRVRLCAILRTVAHRAPLSLGFSRQEHWSGLPCPSPGLFMPGSKSWSIIQWLSDQEDANSPCPSGLKEVDKLWVIPRPAQTWCSVSSPMLFSSVHRGLPCSEYFAEQLWMPRGDVSGIIRLCSGEVQGPARPPNTASHAGVA